MNLGFAASSVFGAALAGGLIAAFGLSAALLVDAASFLVIAIVLVRRATCPRPSTRTARRGTARFVDGLEFARDHRPVRTLLIGQSLALICFTLVVPIEVIYAKESLGTTSAGFGILMSSWGAGIVLGSLLFLWLKNRAGLAMILLSSAAVGLAYLGHVAGRDAARRVRDVGRRRRRQRRPVGRGDDRAAGGDADASSRRGCPACWSRSARRCPGVGFLLGGTIVALGSPRTAFAIAGAGILRAGGRGRDPAAGARVRPRRRPASTIGRRLSRS